MDLDKPPDGWAWSKVGDDRVVVGVSRNEAVPRLVGWGVDVALTVAEDPPAPWVGCEDVDGELSRLTDRVGRWPRAAATLAQVLRAGGGLAVDVGLVLESLGYSTLQGGPEFAAWLEGRPKAEPRNGGDPVLVRRDGGRLTITLNRPEVHNAYNALMRDRLVDALSVAAADPSVEEVRMEGEGPSFCSGGDLAEFGTLSDPASAHLIRVTQSPARLLYSLRDRVTSYLHGSCIGSGIELPAFGGRVVADPGTTIRLPELEMGLIPGAGGTVSLARRMGRHRTAWLVLSGAWIDAPRAQTWGLVDQVQVTSP